MAKLKIYEAIYGAPGVYDTKPGGGLGHLDNTRGVPGVGRGQGHTSAIYQYSEIGEKQEDNSEPLDDNEEDIVDAISKKVNLGPRSRIDLGNGSPHGADYFSSPPVNAGIAENHTNPIRATEFSPYSYNVKPTTVSAVQGPIGLTVGPGAQKTGTQYGSSRPHFDQTEQGTLHDLTYQFEIDSFAKDKDEMMQMAFNKQQNKIKGVLKEINSLFYDI